MKTDEDPEPRRDFDTHGENEAAVGYVSAVTATFLECEQFLKNFLTGFLPLQQDIEDVAQETYLRAYIVLSWCVMVYLISLGVPMGHLVTDESFRDYRLEVEYRFPGNLGNSGVLVHASTPRVMYGIFPQSIEVQLEHGNAGDFWCILEDIEVPDMERRRGPRAEWGTTEDKARHIPNLTDDSEKPLGAWNTMAIEAIGREIRVWVNGDLVNEGTLVTANHGQTAFQSEGSEIEFRRLTLLPAREL